MTMVEVTERYAVIDVEAQPMTFDRRRALGREVFEDDGRVP
jgi:hypothetical protein